MAINYLAACALYIDAKRQHRDVNVLPVSMMDEVVYTVPYLPTFLRLSTSDSLASHYLYVAIFSLVLFSLSFSFLAFFLTLFCDVCSNVDIKSKQ